MIHWILKRYSPPIGHQFADGSTVLHSVALCVDRGNDAQGAVSAVNILLEAGADPTAKDAAGRTPLAVAVMGEVRQALLEAETDQAAAAAATAKQGQQQRLLRQQQQQQQQQKEDEQRDEEDVDKSREQPASVQAPAVPTPEPEPAAAGELLGPSIVPSAEEDAAAISELEIGGTLTMYLASGKKKHGMWRGY